MNRAQKALATVLAAATLATGTPGTPRVTETSALECALIGSEIGTGTKRPLELEQVLEDIIVAGDGSGSYRITQPVANETHTKMIDGIENGYILDDRCHDEQFYGVDTNKLSANGWIPYAVENLQGIGADPDDAIANALRAVTPQVNSEHTRDSSRVRQNDVPTGERVGSYRAAHTTGAIDARGSDVIVSLHELQGHTIYEATIDRAVAYIPPMPENK